MSASTVKANFWRGYREGLPFLLVVVPFGMLFGVVATEAGLNVAQVMGFSVIVIAGAAQFTALQMMADNAPTVVVLATALAVNMRMAMYSASLTPYLGQASLGKRLAMSYMMVDQAHAMSILRFEAEPKLSLDERVAYYAGACISFIPFWYVATWGGAVVGAAIPPEWGLDFVVPVTFLALIGPMLRTLAHVAAAFTSVLLALVFAFLPYNLGLLIAALAALAVGAEVERRRGRA